MSDDRYSYEKEGPRRCGICGGMVVERLLSAEEWKTDHSKPIEVERTCTNPLCNSNTGQLLPGDEV